MNIKRFSRTGAILAIVFLVLVVRYGPAIGGLLYTRWQVRNRPELWVVPTPLRDLSVDRSQGQKFSYIGYEFESPWTEVNKERKGDSIAVLNFSNGEFISISKSNDYLKSMKQAATSRGADIRSVFGDQTTSSNYALRSKILYLTPRYLRLISSRQEMTANSVLLTLKGIWTSTAKDGLYSFQTEWLRGFQVGSPAQNSTITIDAFDAQDREIQLTIGTEPNASSRPSQAEVNRILYSLRPAHVFQ
jgi:hypothetical protein